MNPGEHEVMARVEDGHWWYRGLRDAVARCLASADCVVPPAPKVLDAGCGTGANLRLLARLLDPGYLAGFDLSDAAVRIARERNPDADVYVSDLCAPELRTDGFDLIVSLDVLYIPGLVAAREGLLRLVASLAPGGLMVLNLPAYDWLFSEHDVAVHTRERYTVPRVRRLLEDLGLEPVRLSYRLCVLFPVVVAARLPSLFRARPGDPAARSDLHRLPPPVVSSALLRILELENRAIARGFRWPFGSSVFAVGRRP